QEELLKAINDAGLTAEGLTTVLKFAGALVQRETLRAAMLKERMAQASAVQASETKLQELQAQFDAIDAQLAAQA
ncbi:MAG: hypothetical protein ACRCV5_13320, partial [Afipia sp.]